MSLKLSRTKFRMRRRLRPRTNHKTWHTVNWASTDCELSERYKISRSTVRAARKLFDPALQEDKPAVAKYGGGLLYPLGRSGVLK